MRPRVDWSFSLGWCDCILEMALKGGFSYVGRRDRKLCWPRRGSYGVYYQGSSEVESPQDCE